MPAAESKLDTPLMRQYRAIKDRYPHAIVFFRLGDFYEMFGEDAKTASPILGVVLTGRQGIAMCGVPFHSSANYIAKLLKAGHKVAVAEQMEDPAKAKGLVRRQVTRLVTPGTVVEDELLDASAANYLAAVEIDTVGWGLACMEVSTGEFWATQALNDPSLSGLLALLAKIDAAEILAPPGAAENPPLRNLAGPKTSLTYYDRPIRSAAPNDSYWNRESVWRNHPLAAKAAARALDYVAETQSHISAELKPSYREPRDAMHLDESAIRTLELLISTTGDRKHSLWGALDKCRTAMGSRKMKSWILHPSLDVAEIERRQNCVEELLEKDEVRIALSRLLSEISDLERVASRLGTKSAAPRDMAALRDCLAQADALRHWLKNAEFCSGLTTLAPALDELLPSLKETHRLLERALAERPPMRLSDGGIIRIGFDAELDELRSIKNDSRKYLGELESKERSETGIGSLKMGYTSVFGYYIEVTRAHLSKVPARYHRKQTLTNAERFITPELKELETKILGAEDKILRLEAALFETVRAAALDHRDSLSRFAAMLAELDVLNSLADAAHLYDFVKPKVDWSHDLIIEEGRHPMVEAALPSGAFVPNSIALHAADPQILILTGPNMGGKSTYLRQNALIAVMAQMGSFVPAKSARIGIVDKILTRIGSQDALARNESTFMVEMRETSQILQAATVRSLIILDEVGRGTSTYDGISIAWAVVEHLNRAYGADREYAAGAGDAAGGGLKPRGPRTLFATHYFELTELAELLPGVRNVNVEAREWTTSQGHTEVVFLHKISSGPADRSFGIHVAQLAGLPPACLARAREILSGLENKSRAPQAAQAQARIATNGSHIDRPLLPLFDEHPVLSELRGVDVDRLTPMEALTAISRWKKIPLSRL